MSLNKTELLLIARLLRISSDEFSHHGCNDFELPADDVHKTLLAQAERSNNPKISKEDLETRLHVYQGGHLITMDWFMMSYLARRCKEAAEGE